ncbi:MAG: glucuronyl hydrolase [Chitinophagaceae bacterium]|nr:MAG: glucuronyl hydrolase [Chitinophagaceae bacterium]
MRRSLVRFCKLAFLISLIATSCAAPKQLAFHDDLFFRQIDTVLLQSAAQYKMLAASLPADAFPRNWDPRTAILQTSSAGWWCSGFYPGTLLQLFGSTKDSALYREAMRMLPLLAPEQYNRGTHDLGFMLYNSFGTALRFEDRPEWKALLLQGAQSLASRYNERVGAIRSWDGKPGEYLVIIDNMMNLELLLWASKVSGDRSLADKAIRHAETTMQHHFRSNGSSWHVLNYDTLTGNVLQKRTAQGFSDSSAWARGQAWALYGYTALYRHTRNVRYLQQARKVAWFLLNHPRMPADGIPYWDFDAPGENVLRDASAAAIIASALVEMQGYSEGAERSAYRVVARKILQRLMTPDYLASAGTNGGFLLRHSVGHLPAGSEVDVALTYADYYFVEALLRYRMLR